VGVRAVLADGQVGLLRLLGPDDQGAVLRLYESLDERDRYFRFFGPLPARVNDLVFGMTAPVDVRHASMGAFLDEELIGVAHYEVLAEPTEAEVALAVLGTVQAHGVGTLLLDHLVSLARRHGVRRLVAEVLTENGRMLRVFADCGLPHRVRSEGSVTHVELVLDEVETYLDAMAERERVADTASLRSVLCPESLVVVGAGRRPGSIGHAVLVNIITGGYSGQLCVVNPHTDQILGVPAFPTVGQLPIACELAVVCVPAHAVPEVAEQCGRRGVRALVVISAGLASDKQRHDRLVAAVRRYGMRMVGPNCVGVSNSDPAVRLDATFAPAPAPSGGIGLVTQSGGMDIALREQLGQLGLGLSVMVSTGEKYDVSGNDLLMWWRHDDATTAVALYLESFGNPRKFGRLSRALAREKPVLAVRTAHTEAAHRAAASDTTASDTTAAPAVTRDALFRQAGVIAVDTPAELVGTLAALSWQPLPRGNRVAVVTNAAASGVAAADTCALAGVVLADLSPATVATLRALLPESASPNNPVHTTAAVDVGTFNRCVTVLRADPGVDAVIAATVRTAVGDPITALATIVEGDKPLLAVRLGQRTTLAALPDTDGVPKTASYADPAAAIAVLGRVAEYTRWLRRPNPPATLPPEVDAPRALAILRDIFRTEPTGGWLGPLPTVELLRCFGIPMIDTRLAPAAGDAVAAGGRELMIGMRSDGVFGPLVVFGLGGVDTDVVSDRTARLAPLGDADTDDLLHGLRCSDTLFGPHAAPVLDNGAVRDVLGRVSLLAQLLPEVIELDLNPLIASPDGCQAANARIRVAPTHTVDPFLPGLRG
jgi:acyl-CoA synthetase (NDP forming)/GNAT superfamily N-acetyltransferase